MASITSEFRIVGYHGAPSLEPPGSTAASLRCALDVGANGLMVEIRRTRDDMLLIASDPLRVIDGVPVPLRDRSLREWREKTSALDTPITTLLEAIEIAAEAGASLIIHLPELDAAALLTRVIRQSKFPLESLLVVTDDETSRAIMRGLDPRIPLAHPLNAEDANRLNAQFLADLDASAVICFHRLITPAVVRALKARDVNVFAWTVDTPEDLRRLRDTCLVDGVITNFPDILAAVPK